MKLVKFSRDWSDEFEAEGFCVLLDEEWEKFSDFVEKNPDALVSFWFGTNEGWEDETIESFYDCYKVVSLFYEEEKMLQDFFGRFINFGICPDPLALIESLDEENL